VKSTLIFCLLLASFCVNAQKNKPLLHLLKGQTYYLTDTTVSTSLQTIGAREGRINTTISFRVAFNVAAKTDTLYTLEATYQSLTMKIKLPDTTLDINSAVKHKTDTLSAIMSEMVNKPFIVMLTAGGKVKSITNLDEMIATALKNFPSIDSVKKSKIGNQFTQAFGESLLTGVLEIGIAVLPEKPVAKDERWVINSTIASPALAQVHTNYQLADLAPGFYLVKGQGTIGSEKDANATNVNGMPATYDLNGSLMSEIKIDKSTGWVNEVKLKQLIEESIDIKDNTKIPGGINVPMMFTTEMTINGGKQ
jgi:hypothetical protein